MTDDAAPTRRQFLDRLGQLSVAAVAPATLAIPTPAASADQGPYDLSWLAALEGTTDRAVVDGTGPSDLVLQIAARYLDNCDAVYGTGRHAARVAVTLRVRAIPLAMNDDLWRRYSLATEYQVKDRANPSLVPDTNPFLRLPPGQGPEYGGVEDLVARRGIFLVCDFAMGHLATRLARKYNEDADAVHRALVTGLVPGAYAVPSGIFGLARAQNAGCAFIDSRG